MTAASNPRPVVEVDAASPATTGIAANPQPVVESDIPDPFAPEVGADEVVDLGPLSVVLEIAAGIEHERQAYRRCVERESDLRDEIERITDRRLEAFGNLAIFGRSPFVPEWTHHVPPSDPATNEAFDNLVNIGSSVAELAQLLGGAA